MKRIRNSLKSKIVRNYLLLTIICYIVEIIFRIINSISLFGWPMLRIFLVISMFTLPIAYIVSLFKNKTTKTLMIIISSFLCIFIMIQMGCYNFLGNYLSLNIATEAKNADGFILEFLKSITWDYYFLLIPIILLILYYIFIEPKYKTINTTKKPSTIIKTVLMIIILNISFYLTIIIPFMQNKYQIVSNKELFNTLEVQGTTINQFGIYGFEFLDIKTNLFPKESTSKYRKIINNNAARTITEYSRIINDDEWKSIINTEKSNTLNTLNSYYINKPITDKNEYTGYFEEKNLIMIMVESGSFAMTNYPEYFPTISKMYSDGWAWINNYSSKNQCATINNEMTSLTSLYTITNSCTASSYRSNTYPNSLFNLFKDSNYTTTSYHDYIDSYYDRSIIHTNMGSSNYYNANDLGINVEGYRNWPSDVELIQKSLPHFINDDKFMVFMTTVTTHLPYAESSVYGDKNLDLFEDLDLSKSSKRYLSKIKELDNALELLLKELKNNNKLDDTVILLFCDHYPYGLSNGNLEDLLHYDVSENKERERTPLIIYNPTIKSEKFSENTTLVNLLPTIANLFNLNYDPRLYSGSDLFSPDYESIAIFHDESWKNDYAYYDAITGEINYLTSNKTYADSEIYDINVSVNEEIKMSNLAIKNNYFNYLYNKINK